jgi:hypothetical protein
MIVLTLHIGSRQDSLLQKKRKPLEKTQVKCKRDNYLHTEIAHVMDKELNHHAQMQLQGKFSVVQM